MEMFTRKRPVIKKRCIHLDLKGMPPTSSRLLQLPEIFENLKINCLLVEWEDTYPWKRYPELSNKTAYSERTVHRFLKECSSRNIEVIPLVQCLGHVENLLLKKRFAHLKEVPESAGELCPLKPDSQRVITQLIEDILSTHHGFIQRFHLGGDEPWTFGSCHRCKEYIRKNGADKLYLKYVLLLLDCLSSKGIRGLFWDDEMRKWPLKSLKRLGKKAGLVVWQYDTNIFKSGFPKLEPQHLDRYDRAGISWWGAPAFKRTASGDLPKIDTRLCNIQSWIKALRQCNKPSMIVTGWSRGDFCSVQMCGLEPAWDVIVLAAALMWDGKLPQNYVVSARQFIAQSTLKELIGKHYFACFEAAKNLQEWDEEISNSKIWKDMEQSASVSFEPERINPYTCIRFHSFSKLEQKIAQGAELGKKFIDAHHNLVPKYWLKKYIDARVRHKELRFTRSTHVFSSVANRKDT